MPGNKLIRGDDDLYILQVAHEIDVIVLSNNQYQQYWDIQPIYWEKALCPNTGGIDCWIVQYH